MTTGTLIWAIVLALFGLNVSLVAWTVLRFTTNAFWALAGFNAILLATIWGIFELVA